MTTHPYVLIVACSTCRAAEGERCRKGKGHEGEVHAARLNAADRLYSLGYTAGWRDARRIAGYTSTLRGAAHAHAQH